MPLRDYRPGKPLSPIHWAALYSLAYSIFCLLYSSALLSPQHTCTDRTTTRLIREIVNAKRYHDYRLGKHGVRAMDICGGRPTIKYTRIEIAGMLDRLAAGESMYKIVAGCEGRVSREALTEAIQIVTAGFLETLPTLEPVSCWCWTNS